MHITLDVHPRVATGAEEILRRTACSSQDTSNDSELLKAIKSALRGADAYSSRPSSSSFLNDRRDPPRDDEICWDSTTVVASNGGIVRKIWTFTDERQPVQYACLAPFEESWRMVLPSRLSPAEPSSSSRPQESPTFGPFAQTRFQKKAAVDKKYTSTAVFVFLRSIGKVYLRNGIEYTFQLPFIVRKAWPLSPHGVLIQRVLEPYEIHEARLSGDEPLPTLFSFTNPFAEATAVGVTQGIVSSGGNASLADEKFSSDPEQTVPHSEMVIFTSFRTPTTNGEFELVVTVDPGQKLLTIWRYIYIKPKDSHMVNQPTYTQLKPPASATPSLASLAKSAPSLTNNTTMASLMSAASGSGDPTPQSTSRPRRNSLTRNDLTSNLDNLVLGGGAGVQGVPSVEYGKMTSTYWMEKLATQELSQQEAEAWRDITVALFDCRANRKGLKCMLGICIPRSKRTYLYQVFPTGKRLVAQLLGDQPSISIAPVEATRRDVRDLLVVPEDGKSLVLLTHGLEQIQILLRHSQGGWEGPPISSISLLNSFPLVQVDFSNGTQGVIAVDLLTRDVVVTQSFQMLSKFLTPSTSFHLHASFLELWERHSRRSDLEFPAFEEAVQKVFDLTGQSSEAKVMDWEPGSFADLLASRTSGTYRHDTALKHLDVPSPLSRSSKFLRSPKPVSKIHPELGAGMLALHLLCEEYRLQFDIWLPRLHLLASLVCRMAFSVRPQYVDHWKRKLPYLPCPWPGHSSVVDNYEDPRIPIWPPDFYVILQYKMRDHQENGAPSTLADVVLDINCNPNATKVPLWPNLIDQAFGPKASLEYGHVMPLKAFQALFPFYSTLSEGSIQPATKRVEKAVYNFFRLVPKGELLNRLPLGLAAPIKEAIRTTQNTPPNDWPLYIYTLIGRNDLTMTSSDVDIVYRDGYSPPRVHLQNPRSTQTILDLLRSARTSAQEVDNITGVELPDDDLSAVRFSSDRRLDEAARLLCSSGMANVRMVERPDLNENDQAKEYQSQLIRVSERTLALSFGRAMLTFGTITSVTREAYVVPKLEFSIRLQPQGITVPPDPGKLLPDSLQWGYFHNGVAAALRVASKTAGIESSWIAFNKPSAMTPQHAGFLFGLGLSGHLKELKTWHTFGYLTMKHDLTSIGVLLGMVVAKVGTGDEHITKLLAVHTPALLPNPTVDLNISMMTQAAGLSGIGLLYLGTKNRRMAEVCLTQIHRPDLVPPSLTNEHREAYTYSAALAFGMIMVGKGSDVPADARLVSRLTALIHGSSLPNDDNKVTFDVNLTSPATTIALGLMYLRTERQDIADILAVPDTILDLNRVQPSFLLFRALARALIMWSKIEASADWVHRQIPPNMSSSLEMARKTRQPPDEAIELGYFNLITGACFALALKHAGSANEAAYTVIVRHFDAFTRGTFNTSSTFDSRLRRSTLRDCLNLMGISLAIIMVGTGELSCVRRLRHAYGLYQSSVYGQLWKYGIHMANSMALGLLFLGGGRAVLGTSNAAIAAMVTAFFPRWHHGSFDNKTFLQALRHVWVLAVEPRCLVVRDVDTQEVVYLPVNLTMKDRVLKLIAPTLFPGLDEILYIKQDSPRYWPFAIDVGHRMVASLFRAQTVFIKRRTSYVSYNVDRKGSRCLLARTGSSAGDGAALDFPRIGNTNNPAAEDLADFLAASPHNPYFLTFADRFCKPTGGEAPNEQLFKSFCMSVLFDCILHDKGGTIQSHLDLLATRMMDHRHRSYHLRLHDLAFASFFFNAIFPVLFAIPWPQDSVPSHIQAKKREPLIREATIHASLYSIDRKLEAFKSGSPKLSAAFADYMNGSLVLQTDDHDEVTHELAWFLVRHGMPTPSVLLALKELAGSAYQSVAGKAPPEGTEDMALLTSGIKEVVHLTGNKMTTSMGSGWSVRGLQEVLDVWRQSGS